MHYIAQKYAWRPRLDSAIDHYERDCPPSQTNRPKNPEVSLLGTFLQILGPGFTLTLQDRMKALLGCVLLLDVGCPNWKTYLRVLAYQNA
ncbi:hypothetical protein J6590_072957 [Homalodisca vitripennis]|nr:hypothetical protein J6590_072957 [Homalodisca vitripennis]